MKRKFLMISFFILIIFLFGGCTGEQQLHQKLIIQGVGIDKSENEYKVIVQALDFQNPIDENEPNTKVIETMGKTVTEALENISKQTSLKAVYSQNLMLILDENLARAGVNDFIDFFIRHCETRPKVKICISKTVSEILKINPKDKTLKSKNIHDLIPLELNSDILHFVSNLKNTKADPFAAWIEINKKNDLKEVHLKGIGIFKEDKLENLISDEDALGFMILKNVANFGSLVVNSEKSGDVTCMAEKITSKTEIKKEKNQIPKFHINLVINASSYSLDKDFYTYNFEKISSQIEKEFSEKIKEICENLIAKTLKSKIDVFDFSRILKNSDPSYFKIVEKNWKEILPNLEYKVNVETKLKVTGKEPV